MERPLQCPSAQPGMVNLTILGVVEAGPSGPRLAYLDERVEPTADVMALTGDANPLRILRFAGNCETSSCRHFDGSRCQLGARIASNLPEVVDILPHCLIRNECRWYAEEGARACKRCPQVVTFLETSDEVLIETATGAPAV